MIRVAIANDTIIALEALRRVIATDPSYELIWTAKNGAEAIQQCQQDCPDLLLMDLLMPDVSGVEATRQIMQRSPCGILIVTASVRRNTAKVFEAMGYGALDVVRTPTLNPVSGSGLGSAQGALPAAAQPLLAKMATVAKFLGKSTRQTSVRSPLSSSTVSSVKAPLIAMGASTGGPKAIANVLSRLPADFNSAIVVVQHIDQQFAEGLADWLNQQTPLRVKLANSGAQPEVGTVLVAKARQHLAMQPDGQLAYVPATSASDYYYPSVDVFFQSLAEHWPRRGKAILLTGMGRDGAAGLGRLRAAGWETIAESEETCVVYGMPRAAIEQGAACRVLPLEKIADAIAYGL
ncbi:MAG: chemotaxis-specific protein-glutamate methyltransferase CheB [Cyanobacteria bacterium J06634_5]